MVDQNPQLVLPAGFSQATATADDPVQSDSQDLQQDRLLCPGNHQPASGGQYVQTDIDELTASRLMAVDTQPVLTRLEEPAG